jgi:hypothetical protein
VAARKTKLAGRAAPVSPSSCIFWTTPVELSSGLIPLSDRTGQRGERSGSLKLDATIAQMDPLPVGSGRGWVEGLWAGERSNPSVRLRVRAVAVAIEMWEQIRYSCVLLQPFDAPAPTLTGGIRNRQAARAWEKKDFQRLNRLRR